ncbi:MAG: hypothetical protein ACXVBZ_15930 [Flavisolibacter sp.]
MPGELTATDPLGNTVHLLPEVYFAENKEKGIYDDVTMVISKPAAFIEVKEEGETLYYYFRSVGWNKALLIISHYHNERWEAFRLVQNPPAEMMSAILKKGRQII